MTYQGSDSEADTNGGKKRKKKSQSSSSESESGDDSDGDGKKVRRPRGDHELCLRIVLPVSQMQKSEGMVNIV